jgi:osmotically-inducible protein OsmY
MEGTVMDTKHLPSVVALAVTLAAGVTLAACNPAAEKSATSLYPPEGQTTALADRPSITLSDTAISVAVNAALVQDQELSALRIDVNTVEGHVVLDGAAPDASARQRATAVARSVRGVKSVDNRLALPPAG